ncbi:alpha-amylase family glycosyl hydrolase [Aquimarina sp. W85]|uniref:alpha-amylase family glycosyl hydrolase n=1 Tax=Aquimarina rhodophyticola TaxID=3342246 RepID=UPI00366F5299
MKIFISTVIAGVTVLLSCGKAPQEYKKEASIDTELPANLTHSDIDSIAAHAVIYEANIRQYSPEGSFNAFTKDIPSLRKLGVKILWLMPIYPISSTKSKGSLGSYYAVSDYKKVNPEFGSLEDFRNLVRVAHDNDMLVILDWVANHTGWDHPWITSNPTFYSQDKDGNIVHTEGTDWTDVADLNYDTIEMQQEMSKAMMYWVTKHDIDGFRCDVAAMVPVQFWRKTISKLEEIKPMFMLAEAWEPELLNDAFDMAYGWDTHHVMNKIAKGEKNVIAWHERMTQIDTLYNDNALLMNFTSNHDENSWNGTVDERMGEAKKVFAALSFVAPGMPLIYSGQEYDLDKRLLFFDKDSIDKQKGIFYPLYEKLGKLKNDHPALTSGKNASDYTKINTSDNENILAFARTKNKEKIIFIGNLSNTPKEIKVGLEGVFKNYMTDRKEVFSNDMSVLFKPWEYKILSVN